MSFIASNNDVDNTGGSEVVLKSPTGTDLLGQLTMAASLPVVIASDQTAIPISAASLPLPTGAATAALQTTGNSSLSSIDAGIPAALGQTTMSASMPVTISSDQSFIPMQTYGTNSHYTRISTNTTTVVKSGAGFLRRVIKMSGGNITMYDNTAGSGTVIQAVTGVNPNGTIVYDIPFTTGLTIVSTSGPDVIIVYD